MPASLLLGGGAVFLHLGQRISGPSSDTILVGVHPIEKGALVLDSGFMPSTPDPVVTSVNVRLADYFAAQKETIISEWLERVRHDPEIASESLSIAALKNHLPQLFDDLVETFRHYNSADVADQTIKDAASHGTTRWRQGFHLKEVLRELMHLRAGLIYHLCQFEEGNEDFGIAARFFVLTTLHRFLDDLGMGACEQFLVEEGRDRISG